MSTNFNDPHNNPRQNINVFSPLNAAADAIHAARSRIPIVIDTREKLPYEFDESKFTVEKQSLETGDYSIDGYQHIVSVERKTAEDFFSSITHSHPRFYAEINRLSEMPHSVILVEASLSDYLIGKFSERMSRNAMYGNIFFIQEVYRVPIVFAGDRQCGINYIENYFRWLLKKSKNLRDK